MDFSPSEITPELEEFAREVGEWLDENIPEDMEFPRDPCNVSYEQFQKRRELGRKIGEKGWLFPSYPRRYGGGGLDTAHSAMIRREATKRKLELPPYHSAGGVLGAPAILACGTGEQKKFHLPKILRDGALTWECFTEPEAGSDEANQQTNALRSQREGEYFIVNGDKIFVGGLYPPPDLMLLLTRSDLEAPRHENLVMFLVPGDLPGISITPLDLFVPGPFDVVKGQSTTSADAVKHQVFFDDVKVHQRYLIGGDRDGWKAASATLEVEHGIGAMQGDYAGGRREDRFFAGVERSYIVERFLDQCKNNPNINRRIKENPELLSRVLDVYIDAEKERLYTLRNMGGRGGPYGGIHSQLFSKLFALRLVEAMAEVLGPYTMTGDDEWAPEAGLFEVGQRGAPSLAPTGTPEVLKIVMSRALRIGR
ncbi:acyl-CoA dehydrogenase family protein [Chloroflexota bacterium]